MNALLGSRDDINFVLTATSKGVTIHRPDSENIKPIRKRHSEEGNPSENATVHDSEKSTASSSNATTPVRVIMDSERPSTSSSKATGGERLARPQTARKRRHEEHDPLLEYLKQSDEKIEKREKDFLQEMQNFHKSFTDSLNKLADKLP